MDDLDGLLLSAFNFIKSSQTATFSITAPTVGSIATGDSHKLFRCDATAGAMAGNLPAASAAGNGFTVAFKKTDSTAHAVTLTAAGSDKIDGSGTFALSAQYNWAILVSDGVSAWDILSDTVSTAGFATLSGSNTYTGANDFTGGDAYVTTQGANTANTKAASTAYADRVMKVYSGSTTPVVNPIIQCGRVQQNANTVTAVSFPITLSTVLYAGASVEGDTTTSSGGDIGAVKTNAVTGNGMNLVYCDDVNGVFTSWMVIGIP